MPHKKSRHKLRTRAKRKSLLHHPILHLVVVLSLIAGVLLYVGAKDKSLAAICTNTSEGLTPINDLGTGMYKGFQGGLYPGGSNAVPAAHLQKGKDIAATIQPLDANGNPDPVNGKIVFVSIGHSNSRNVFSGASSDGTSTVSYPDAFKPTADLDPEKNPKVVIVSGSEGGMSISRWLADEPDSWDLLINSKLPAAGVTYKQVQAVWIYNGRGTTATLTFPQSSYDFRDDNGSLLRMSRQKLPNVKIAYISSDAYMGYSTDPDRAGEPDRYEGGFGIKWVIENQINGLGDLNPDPDGNPATNDGVAPWVSWGPYLFADGTTPRSDGLTWICSDFNSDGVHPNNDAAKKVTSMLLPQMKTDPTACTWFTSTNCGVNPLPSATPTPLPPTATPTPPVIACSAPTILTKSDSKPTSGGTVKLTWGAVSGATQYKVDRQNSNGTWSTRQTSSSTSFSGSDSSSDPNWRVFVSSGSCSPLPGPATVLDP